MITVPVSTLTESQSNMLSYKLHFQTFSQSLILSAQKSKKVVRIFFCFPIAVINHSSFGAWSHNNHKPVSAIPRQTRHSSGPLSASAPLGKSWAGAPMRMRGCAPPIWQLMTGGIHGHPLSSAAGVCTNNLAILKVFRLHPTITGNSYFSCEAQGHTICQTINK